MNTDIEATQLEAPDVDDLPTYIIETEAKIKALQVDVEFARSVLAQRIRVSEKKSIKGNGTVARFSTRPETVCTCHSVFSWRCDKVPTGEPVTFMLAPPLYPMVVFERTL